jgi:hypothetical protein
MTNSIDHFINGFNHLRAWFGYNMLDRDKGAIKITIDFPTFEQKHGAGMALRRDLEAKYRGYFNDVSCLSGVTTMMGIQFEFTTREKHWTTNSQSDADIVRSFIERTADTRTLEAYWRLAASAPSHGRAYQPRESAASAARRAERYGY